MKKLLRKLLFALLISLLTSCGMLDGPAYKRPELQEKGGWSNTRNNVTTKEVIRPDWWSEFDDAFLNQLVNQSVESNLDLQLLSSRLRLAGIQVGLEKTGQMPKIGTVSSTALNTGRSGTDDPLHNIGVSLSWELDIWGKLQKGVDASKATYLSTEALWRGGYLKLVSDVSIKYFQIRQFDQQTRANQTSLKLLRYITQIYREQLSEGLVPEIKVLKQEAEINGTLKNLLDLHRQRKVAENELAILLGYPAGDYSVPVTSAKAIKIPTVPAGLPADLLSRRPDLIAAEYQVLSAHFLVGKAQLSRLPTISMTSQGGLVNDLISGAMKTYTFGIGPTINIPIFDPSLGKTIESTKESEISSIIEYKSKVLRAFADVENSLINLSSRKAQQIELEQQYLKLKIVKDQVIEKLKEGLVSQLEVLEAERSLISNELTVLEIRQLLLTDTVTLYKALGGGWPIKTVKSSDITDIHEN